VPVIIDIAVHQQLIGQLATHSPEAAAIFSQQWEEIRGTWEREDWEDRIQAHIRFMERHEWDGVRWRVKVSETPPSA